MQRILSAIFDNRRDAEAAMSELLLSGFPRGAMRLGSGDPAEAVPASGPDPASPRGDGGGNFFHTLFGTDDSAFVRNIDGAVTHSHLVLTVVTPDLSEVERAAAIVERYGPLDIDSVSAGADAGIDDGAKASSSAAGAWMGGGAQSVSHSGPLSQQQAEPPGAVHASAGNMQRADLSGAGASAAGDHEAAWRAHHASQSGSAAAPAEGEAARFPGDEHYDEYAPAYLYGLDMATHEQHGGKEWEEAEPALRGEWEQRHPQSAWDKFRHAVKHGWDRLRGGAGGS